MTPRERRVVAAGVAVVLLTWLATRVLQPAARDMLERESRIVLLQDRVERLQRLAADSAGLREQAAATERRLATMPRRMLPARSAPLAASAVQTLLQEAADGARLAVNRIEVATEPDSSGALAASIMAYGDIHGLAAFLASVERGPRLLQLRRLVVQQNSALRGAPDVLSLSAQVSAPVMLDGIMPPSPGGLAASDTGAATEAARQPPDWQDALVRANLFSASRTAPRTRFTLPGEQPPAEAPGMDANTQSPASADTPQLTLVGLFGNSERRAALIDDGSGGDARVLHIGDRMNGWRLQRIDASSVRLERAGQVRVLRLLRTPSSDSSE
ncbi:MAG: type 4a pilus biogenesis protein PilO [Gemmatimonadaceae bacterium]|nr:type 4a pilus biogenesis protein PilO [Gemmatimonadaceae bacterium]